MTTPKKYREDFTLFLEAGYIAVNQADEDSANKLFAAAEQLEPQNALPKLGRGYLHLHKLELKQACKAFEDILDQEPNNHMAKAFLGIALSMQPSTVDKGEKILKETHKSKEFGINSLSETAIDFVERFIKKTPGPAGKSNKRP